MSDLDFLDRTRSSYDTMAALYTETFRAALAANPMDRAQLAVFAELTLDGPVADVGCGPGRLTGLLHALGLDVFGVDLSPAMVEQARRECPGLRFEVGSMTALELADVSLGGLAAWYSTIHVPDAHLPAVFAEFRRVLAPGAPLTLAFQVGDGVDHRADAWGLPVDLRFHRRSPEVVAGLLVEAGFAMVATTVREPLNDARFGERLRQAYLIARRAC